MCNEVRLQEECEQKKQYLKENHEKVCVHADGLEHVQIIC